jgi:hypothetical protein
VAPPVRPELGPTLPALLRGRLGVPERVTIALVALLVLTAVALALGFRPGDPTRQVVHRGTPVFNVLHDPGPVRRARARGGELMRFEGRRRRARLAFTVRRGAFARGPGVPTGRLAVAAERHLAAVRAARPGLDVRELGKDRVNDAPAFEVAYAYGPRRRRTYTRDLLVVSPDPRVQEGLVLRFTQTVAGRLGPRARARSLPMREAWRSFRYGTEAEER